MVQQSQPIFSYEKQASDYHTEEHRFPSHLALTQVLRAGVGRIAGQT